MQHSTDGVRVVNFIMANNCRSDQGRRWHAQACHDELAFAVVSGAYDGGWVVGEDARLRRQVASAVPQRTDQIGDRLDVAVCHQARQEQGAGTANVSRTVAMVPICSARPAL